MTETTQPPTTGELAQWRKDCLNLDPTTPNRWRCLRLLDALETARREIERARVTEEVARSHEYMNRCDLERAQAVVEAARPYEYSNRELALAYAKYDAHDVQEEAK